MHAIRSIAVVIGGLTLASVGVAAQTWGRPPVPRNGACFYEDINYGGRYFCTVMGAFSARVTAGANDSISSIRVFGDAEVTVFKDGNYRGGSRRFTSSIRDLRRSGWNDKITSYRVESRSGDNGWGGGAYGGGGFGGGSYGGGAYGGAYGGGGDTGRTWGTTGSGVNRMTRRQARQIVDRGYRTILRRDPDPGSEPWVDEVMKRNLSQAQFNAELMKSDEYRQRIRRQR